MNTQQFQIGSRLRHESRYGTKIGIIYAIQGEQAPGNVRSIGGGVVMMGGRAQFSIVYDNGTKDLLPEALARSDSWYPHPGIATADNIRAALEGVETRRADDKRKAEEAAAERKATIERIKRDNPHLRLASLDGNGRVTGAKNIRTELRAAFPGVKFSVTSEVYSGGCSIRVGWEDGPTVKQVEAIADKYAEGIFNSMEDIYESSRDPWTDIFGGAKYVTTSREVSEDLVRCAIVAIADRYGLPDGAEPSAGDFKAGRLGCKGPGEGDAYGYHSWQDMIHRQMSELAA